MADPTGVVSLVSADTLAANRHFAPIKDAEALQVGGHISVDKTTGKQEFSKAGSNLIPAGFVVSSLFGDNTNRLTGDSSGDNKSVATGSQVFEVDVTGASGITDVTKYVYAVDGQTFTLTPQNGIPVGYVFRWISGTKCAVYFFSFKEGLDKSTQPLQGLWPIGLFPMGANALQGTAAIDILSNMPQYQSYQIDSFHARCVAADNAVVAGDQNLNLEIGTTDVTGGVLNLVAADCDADADLANVIDATAITGNNIVKAGDNVSIELASGGTGFTADTAAIFALYAKVTFQPGA
jgi:hypothetical protein